MLPVYFLIESLVDESIEQVQEGIANPIIIKKAEMKKTHSSGGFDIARTLG